MKNRHNDIQPPPREKHQSVAQIQLQGTAKNSKPAMPLLELIKNIIDSGSSGFTFLPFNQETNFSLSTLPLSILSTLQSTASMSTWAPPSSPPTSTSASEKVSEQPSTLLDSTVSDRIEIESCSSLYDQDEDQTEGGVISINTVEAEKDARWKLTDFEKAQIMPQELFIN